MLACVPLHQGLQLTTSFTATPGPRRSTKHEFLDRRRVGSAGAGYHPGKLVGLLATRTREAIVRLLQQLRKVAREADSLLAGRATTPCHLVPQGTVQVDSLGAKQPAEFPLGRTG